MNDAPKMSEITTIHVPYEVMDYEKVIEGMMLMRLECSDGIVYIIRLPNGKWDKK